MNKLSLVNTSQTMALKPAINPGWQRLTVAFIAGMVLTAVAVQAVFYINDLARHKVNAPANIPELNEPGISPEQVPASGQRMELVRAIPVRVG